MSLVTVAAVLGSDCCQGDCMSKGLIISTFAVPSVACSGILVLARRSEGVGEGDRNKSRGRI